MNGQENIASVDKYHCEMCKDTEWILKKDEHGRDIAIPCKCQKQKLNDRRLSRTHLYHKKDEYTFENYIAIEKWQKDALRVSKEYVKSPKGWYYIGGQVGSGKTHLATSVTRNLAYIHNMSFDYMLFNEKITEFKQIKFDDKEKYRDEIARIKNIDILFIDDLFKIMPSSADLDIFFDIINNRYINNKICIISSEKHIQEHYTIDQAIGSRIIEKCKGHCINISFETKNNYRLK